MKECSLVSTPSPAFIVCRIFDDGHSDWCEMISHCSFDLHFSNSDVEHLFMFYWPSVCLFGEMSVWVCSFFDWAVNFSDIELYELLMYFGD